MGNERGALHLHTATPGLTAAGRAYMFLGSPCRRANEIMHALNRIKGAGTGAPVRMRMEMGRMKAMPEPMFPADGPLKGTESAGKLRNAHFSAYPLAQLYKGSLTIGRGECPLIPLADAWQRKGAGYMIRMLLPGSTNYEVAQMLEAVYNTGGFRMDVACGARGLPHEVYFRDDNGVFVSMSQFGIAMQALAKITGLESEVPKSGVLQE